MQNIIVNLGEGDSKKFYNAYLEIMQPVLKLRKREREILALFLYYNNQKKSIEKEDRLNIVFNINTRKKICEELGVSNSVIQQVLNSLREKEMLKGIKFNPVIEKYCDKGEVFIGFKLKINGSKD